MNPFLAFCLYVAARVFIQYLKFRPKDEQMISSLQFLLAAMHALKKKNPLTESFLVQLDVDLEGMNIDVGLRVDEAAKTRMVGFAPQMANRGTNQWCSSVKLQSTTIWNAVPCSRFVMHKHQALPSTKTNGQQHTQLDCPSIPMASAVSKLTLIWLQTQILLRIHYLKDNDRLNSAALVVSPAGA